MVDDGDEVAGQEHSRGARDHHNLSRVSWGPQSNAEADGKDRENDDESPREAIAPPLAWEPALQQGTPSHNLPSFLEG